MKVILWICIHEVLLLMLRWCETMSQWKWAANGLIVHPPDDIWVNIQQWWNDIDRKTEGLREKPVPVPLYPPQIPHGLPWAWTWASVVRSWRLTAWTLAWPMIYELTNSMLVKPKHSKLLTPKILPLIMILSQFHPPYILKTYSFIFSFEFVCVCVWTVAALE
jgi:hypothetical protein